MGILYNTIDCTISVSDAEGFGLSMLESLSCAKPIICTMTGGMQEQVTDGENFFGIGIEPASKAIIGSQEIPWIYEDRLNGEDVVQSLLKMYNMPKEERIKIGQMGYEHAEKNFSYDKYKSRWVEIIDGVIDKNGSWENRKNYTRWTLKEI